MIVKKPSKVLSITCLTLLLLSFIHPVTIRALTSPPYFVYVTLSQTDRLLEIDPSTQSISRDITIGLQPNGIVVSPTSPVAYIAHDTCQNPETVTAVNLQTGAILASIPVDRCARQVAITPDGSRAYVTTQGDTYLIYVIDTATNTVVNTIDIGGAAMGITISADGTRAYAMVDGNPGWISVLDLTNDSVLTTIFPPAAPTNGILSVDGSKLFVTVLSQGLVSVIDTNTNSIIQSVAVCPSTMGSCSPFGIDISHDSSKVFVTIFDGFVSILDANSYDRLTSIPVGAGTQNLAVTPDDAFVYAANRISNTISVIETATNTVINTIPVAEDSGPWGVTIWEVDPPTPIFNFSGFLPPVNNPPAVNSMKAGGALQVKFSLSGNQGLNIFVPGYPTSSTVACGATVEDAVEQTAGSLTYHAKTDQYVYTWNTNQSWAGTCRTLVIKLSDGTYHQANFRFK